MAENWVSYPDLEFLVGRVAADVLTRMHGGTSLYIPKSAELPSKLSQLIGHLDNGRVLRALTREYGGDYIVVPNGRKIVPHKRKILEMLDEGYSHKDIALTLGVTQRHVRSVAGQMRPRVMQLHLF